MNSIHTDGEGVSQETERLMECFHMNAMRVVEARIRDVWRIYFTIRFLVVITVVIVIIVVGFHV